MASCPLPTPPTKLKSSSRPVAAVSLDCELRKFLIETENEDFEVIVEVADETMVETPDEIEMTVVIKEEAARRAAAKKEQEEASP